MSQTIAIPGGQAVIFDADELTPRRERPLQNLGLRGGDLFNRVFTAKTVTGPDGSTETSTALIGPDVKLTAEEADLILEFQPIMAWAYLKDWTLDIPLPADPDAMLDLPKAVYNAVSLAAVGAHKTSEANGFEANLATLENEASPIGASDALATP